MADEETPATEEAEQPAAEGEEAAEGGADAEISEELEQLAGAAEGVAEAAEGVVAEASGSSKAVEFIKDLTLAVTVEVGRARMTIQDLLQLGQGSVVELEKLAGESLDIYVNGKRVAFGEAVIVNEKFGVRLKEIITPEERIQGLKDQA